MPPQDDRRQLDRAPIVLKVEYKRLNTFFNDYTRNISKGGIFIKTPKPLGVGTGFIFKLFVPGLDEPIELRGEVRWTRKAPPTAPKGRLGTPAPPSPDSDPGMGIRLLYDNDDQRLAFERLAEKLMVESLGGLIYSHLRRSGDSDS
jgi:type IV pilus assembly protein PilZ